METRASRDSRLHLHVTDRTPLARVSLRGDIVRIPRYLFHVKRGQVTILCQNGIELGGHEEAEAEGKRRLQEILTESVPGETWQTGGRSLSRMRNGARCSNCRSRVARAIGRRAKAHRSARACRSYGFFPRQKLIASHRLVSLACAAHAKKERAPVRGGRGAQISAEPINLTTIVGAADWRTRARSALGLWPHHTQLHHAFDDPA